jgi:hypothetical protein
MNKKGYHNRATVRVLRVFRVGVAAVVQVMTMAMTNVVANVAGVVHAGGQILVLASVNDGFGRLYVSQLSLEVEEQHLVEHHKILELEAGPPSLALAYLEEALVLALVEDGPQLVPVEIPRVLQGEAYDGF